MRNIIAAVLVVLATIGFISYETHDSYAKQPAGPYQAICVMPDTAWFYCDSQGTLSCSLSATCN